MEKAKSLKGKDLMLWIGGKVVALSKSCDVSLSMATTDENTKDDGDWDASGVGTKSWTVNNESVDSADARRTNDMVYGDLFDLFVAGTPVEVTVGLPTNASDNDYPTEGWTEPINGDNVYGGNALITSLNRKGDKGDNVNVTVSLKGVGPFQRKKIVGG